MKILLIGINAKFIHSNLAIRCLKSYTEKRLSVNIGICEYTINQHLQLILSEIYKQKPDILGFSCYIWNYEMIRLLVPELRKLLPKCKIFLGGPEVSYNSEEALQATSCDGVLCGEGEKCFCDLIDRIINDIDYSDLEGITCSRNGEIIKNDQPLPVSMESIPFPYENADTKQLDHRIVYYEASRGCPFRCQYCLSGDAPSGNAVRYMPLERVFNDLSFFIKENVRQVKFVDRTFNSNKEYAAAIWRFIQANDNGITNFHFEIAAELLDDEMISFLQTVRKGLFQFEIGIQSINENTLRAIKRVTLPSKLTPIIFSLQKNNNIHLHLDLIAGLPHEDYESFKHSFNYVYVLCPDQLQLGFLKLLKGSGLYKSRKELGLAATDFAPYEILHTPCLNHDELLKLKMVEEMVELYYNSNRYKLSLGFLCGVFKKPFDMLEALSGFYEQNSYHLAPHSKVRTYEILIGFANTLSLSKVQMDYFHCCIRYDCYSHEKAKRLPSQLNPSLNMQYHDEIFKFYDNHDNVQAYLKEYLEFDTKQLIRNAHIEVFPMNPLSGEPVKTAILFNYRRCDLLGNAEAIIISNSVK